MNKSRNPLEKGGSLTTPSRSAGIAIIFSIGAKGMWYIISIVLLILKSMVTIKIPLPQGRPRDYLVKNLLRATSLHRLPQRLFAFF